MSALDEVREDQRQRDAYGSRDWSAVSMASAAGARLEDERPAPLVLLVRAGTALARAMVQSQQPEHRMLAADWFRACGDLEWHGKELLKAIDRELEPAQELRHAYVRERAEHEQRAAWVSVKERLPELETWCAGLYRFAGILVPDIVRRTSTVGWATRLDPLAATPLYWAPLPALPEGA